VIKNLPYKDHDFSDAAHEASLAALDQGKYWEMHDLLLARSPKLDRTSLVLAASDLKLDVKRFAADLDAKRHREIVERDKALAKSLDLYSTPTFFINGRKVVGNRDLEYLSKIVEEELQHAKP
jgi:protein-disulfide isomerase